MMHSKETTLLLLLSRVEPARAVFEESQSLIDSGICWDTFMRLSVTHCTANFIYKNLLMLDNIPREILKRFEKIYYYSLRANILSISELDRLIHGLEERGIDVIALKGAPTSESIFGDIALSPFADLDILVKVNDIQRTREFLEAEGYTLNDKGFDEYRAFFIKELYHISLSGYRFTIEPHWNLFFRYFTTPPEFWWEESIRVSSEGREYTFLSPEKNILYTTFRLFAKLFTPLKFLVMVAEVLRHYRDEMDWDKLFRYARQYKFERVLRVTMKLCRDMLGAPVPGDFADIKGLRARVLFRVARRMALHGVTNDAAAKILTAFMRDDLTGTIRVLLRRLLPSRGEIVSRYGVPGGSLKVLFYYVLNPLILLVKRHQKI
jgi:hypothetical protein